MEEERRGSAVESLASSRSHEGPAQTGSISERSGRDDKSSDAGTVSSLTRRMSRVNRSSVSGPPGRFNVWGRRVATIVGVSSRFSRRLSKVGIGDPQEDDENEDMGGFTSRPKVKEDFINRIDMQKLPRKPRFSAVLSPEGQWVLLRGYDDVLVSTIQKLSDQENAGLLRTVCTPPMPNMQTHCVDFARNRNVMVQMNRPQEPTPRTYRDRPPSTRGDSGCITPRLPDSVISMEDAILHGGQQHLAAFTPDTGLSASPSRRTSVHNLTSHRKQTGGIAGGSPIRLPPVERQLISSYRVQNATDILDFLRATKTGQTVLSQRYTRHQIDPVEHYRLWTEAWRKEFTFKPRSETLIQTQDATRGQSPSLARKVGE